MNTRLMLAGCLALRTLPLAQELTPPRIIDPPGQEVRGPKITSAGDRIVFQTESGVPVDLFVLDVDAAAVRVTGPLLPAASLTFLLAPGDQHVLYAMPGSDWYVFPTDLSSGPVRLTGPHAVNPTYLELSSDGTRAIYASEEPLGVPALFSVPVDASAPPVKLTGGFAAGGELRSFQVSPDGATALYVADQDVASELELYRVPTDASAPPVEVHPQLVSGGDVQASAGFEVSPDSSRVTYIADQDTDGLLELYSAPLDGSAPAVKLSSTFGGLADSVQDAWISPDSLRVVYTQNNGLPDLQRGLFTTWLAGGSINGHTTYVDRLDNVRISPDGQRVVWEAGWNRGPLDIDYELRSNPIDGTAETITVLADYSWSWPDSFGGWFTVISEDSQRLVFSAAFGFVLDDRLDSADLESGTVQVLYAGPRDVRSPIGPFGGHMHYAAEYEDLYRVRVDGSEPPQQVDLPGQDDVRWAAVSTNGRGLVWWDGVDHWARWVAVELDSIAPVRGPGAGGTVVKLRGGGFSPDTEVFFGDRPAAAVQFVDETLLLATTPFSHNPRARGPHVARLVDVSVQDVGTRAVWPLAFHYVP